MKCIFTILLVLSCGLNFGQNNPVGNSYTGPIRLGPVNMTEVAQIQAIFSLLNQSPSFSSQDYFCYQHENTYFWFQKNSHEPKVVGSIMLSGFPNCVGSTINQTDEMLSEWKTEEGIALGNSIQDIIDAYGQPRAINKIEGTAYWWVIQGNYAFRNRKDPNLGDQVIVYGSPNDSRSAGFGIRNGKVVWIVLTNSE